MADTAVAEIPTNPSKKGKNSRKALKPKNTNLPLPCEDSDVSAQKSSLATEQDSPTEEITKPKKGKSKGKTKQPQAAAPSSFEMEFQAMQEMMEKLQIEKKKTEEMLKEKDEMLRQKEEELESKGREQEKLQTELKKLQKLKEFRPTVTLPIIQAAKDNEQDKKDKKKKGGPERKRPSPPYTLWCKDHWAEIKKENPDADFKEISSIMGSKWKTITAEEKKPYEEKYQAEKESYLQIVAKEKREAEAMKLLEDEHKQKTAMELLEQYLQFKQETDKETKKTKKEKDPSKPKQAISAFFLFSNDRRPALLAENNNILEVSKILGEEWKNMSEKKKKPYEEMAKKNKEKYMEEMEAYKQKKEEEAESHRKEEEEQMKLQKQEAMQLLKKKEKTENMIKKTKEVRQKKNGEKKNADPNKPKKPASSFLLFSKETRKILSEERPGINNSTLTALISVKWKELSEAERAVWNGKAAEAMEAYKKELEEYNKSVTAGADNNCKTQE